MNSGSSIHWDEEVDVLVFGAGAAGMTAALIAHHEGLDVLLCEKTDAVGGITSTSGGTTWVPAIRSMISAAVFTSASSPIRLMQVR